MTPRHPDGGTPRQLHDCTFQDWEDPIERPAPRDHWLPVVFAWLLAGAAAAVVVWRASA